MRQIGILILITVLLSGCTLFQRGLDVCQDDACFLELAAEAVEDGEVVRAQEFCEAIISEDLKAECFESIQ